MLNQHMIFVLFWGWVGGGVVVVEILVFRCVLGAASEWVCVCAMWCVLFVFLGGGLYINMSNSSLQRQSLLTYIVVGLFLNHSI